MGLLSRKRKRNANVVTANNSTTSSMSSSVSPLVSSSANNTDLEFIRTDDSIRMSSTPLIEISNLDISQSQNCNIVSQRTVQSLAQDMELMDTQIEDQSEHQLSNRWADDLNLSQTEPTSTQFERDNNIKDHISEEMERAKQNVAECGTIESITLMNFMCHQHFHLDFGIFQSIYYFLIKFCRSLGPRINFIVGRNGSKSLIN